MNISHCINKPVGGAYERCIRRSLLEDRIMSFQREYTTNLTNLSNVSN